VKRPGTGISPEKIASVIGKQVNRDIEEDTLIFEEDLND
jgi:sialic acid synthase SpsE